MKKLFILSYVIYFMLEVALQAATFKQIEVVGNQRLNEDYIINVVGIQLNKQYSIDHIEKNIISAYNTQIFEKIDYSIKNKDILVLSIVENPIINNFSIQGNKKVSDAIFKREIILKKYDIFSYAKLDKTMKKIREIYMAAGYFNADITYDVEKNGINRVDITINIKENKKVGVKSIRFIGNEVFSDARLKGILMTKKTSLFSFFSGADSYNENKSL